MKKIKIGLPRALLYHRYSVLWKTFFKLLGCKIIISPETTKDIVNIGINNTFHEHCLSYKIYLGHAIYLSKFCDYVLISNICNYGKKNKVCPQFYGLYDTIKPIIPKRQIIEYNICHTAFNYEVISFFKMGLKITKNPIKIIYSYLIGKINQKKYDIEKANEEKNKFYNSNKKVLIVASFYNINDKFITSYIINYLKNANITPIFANHIDKKKANEFAEFFSDTTYWKYNSEMIGALYFYNHQIDGVIYLSVDNCYIDPLVNNIAIAKNKHLPTINIIIDEFSNEDNLLQELTKFVDIVRGVKDAA